MGDGLPRRAEQAKLVRRIDVRVHRFPSELPVAMRSNGILSFVPIGDRDRVCVAREV